MAAERADLEAETVAMKTDAVLEQGIDLAAMADASPAAPPEASTVASASPAPEPPTVAPSAPEPTARAPAPELEHAPALPPPPPAR